MFNFLDLGRRLKNGDLFSRHSQVKKFRGSMSRPLTPRPLSLLLTVIGSVRLRTVEVNPSKPRRKYGKPTGSPEFLFLRFPTLL